MRNTLLKGTLILTITSLLSRILGFFYRMQLSDAIGADGIGLYQLTFSIAGICMALCAFGIQTAISKYVAEASDSDGSVYLNAGLFLGVSMSLILSLILWRYSDFIANYLLLNEASAGLVRVLSLSIPFSAVHGLISGYFYGKKKTGIPAFSTLFEQVLRVVSVYILTAWFYAKGLPVTASIAMYGMVLGEIGACGLCFISLFFTKSYHFGRKNFMSRCKSLITLSAPLTANRLLMHLLQSGEAILIPAQLQIYGLSSSQALSQYGILTGMALPLILLPTIFSNAVSVLLLPVISEASNKKNKEAISTTIGLSVNLSLLLGIFGTGFFLTYGKHLGSLLFHNDTLLIYIETLAWLCPFLFLAPTLGSILNGLGLTHITAMQNTLGLVIRLAFVIIGIPRLGMTACMWGLLASQTLVCFGHLRTCLRLTRFHFHAFESIVKPLFFTSLSLLFGSPLYFLTARCLEPLAAYGLSSLASCLAYLFLISKRLRALF